MEGTTTPCTRCVPPCGLLATLYHQLSEPVAMRCHGAQVMFMNYGNKEDVSWRDIEERPVVLQIES